MEQTEMSNSSKSNSSAYVMNLSIANNIECLTDWRTR